jgi:hypothetical protein
MTMQRCQQKVPGERPQSIILALDSSYFMSQIRVVEESQTEKLKNCMLIGDRPWYFPVLFVILVD